MGKHQIGLKQNCSDIEVFLKFQSPIYFCLSWEIILLEYNKQYRENNKEKIKAASKEYYKKNVESIKEYAKKYREENKERKK